MRVCHLLAVPCTFITVSLAANECLSSHGTNLADFSNCGDPKTLIDCLSNLQATDEKDIIRCLDKAECILGGVQDQVKLAIRRCEKPNKIQTMMKRQTRDDDSDDASSSTNDDSSDDNSTTEARSDDDSTSEASSTDDSTSTDAASTTDAETTSAETTDAETTRSSDTASSRPSSTIASSTTTESSVSSGDTMSGTMCFTSSTKYTEFCDVQTSGDQTETKTCSKGKDVSSKCGPNLLCTTNARGGDICMKKRGMPTEGIPIAVIFGLAAAGVFGGTFFACFKGSRRQKAAMMGSRGKGESMASLIPK